MKIALLGDIALFGKFDLNTNKKAFEYFSEVSDYLKRYDLVVGNFETPVTDLKKSTVCKSAHLKTVKNNLELLKFLNISIVNLSNNHLFDYGLEGFNSTIEALDTNKIDYFGVDKKDFTPNGTKVCFSGYCCYSTNAVGYLTKNKKHGINVLNGFDVERKLEKDKQDGVLSIVSVHCGDEHIHYPRYDHIRLARMLSEKNDYIFYGHHPHVIQGVEKYNNSLIAYSLGNFCFDDIYTKESTKPKVKQSQENKESFILELVIEGKNLVSHSIIPLYDNGEKIIVNPENDTLMNKINEYSQYLLMSEIDYNEKRSQVRNKYIESRKAVRDMNFYFKRLNFNTLGILLDAKKNKKEYQRNLSTYLDKNE